MTGFFGVINLSGSPSDPAIAQKLLNRIRNCGQDSQQIWTQNEITLGVALQRLTNDTRTEQQPFTLNDITIVADSYLTNRTELVTELSKHLPGEANLLRTAPDPELILHAHTVWGEQTPQYLRGSFRYALWNNHRRRLFLAIDQMKTRTLYYTGNSKIFVFATGVGPLLLHPSVNILLDEESIGRRLILSQYISIDETRTPFDKIRRLGRAQALLIDLNELTTLSSLPQTRTYWSLPPDHTMLCYPNIKDYVHHLRELFTEIVQSYIRTDRIVITLSGGMDSTTIAAVAREIQQRSATQLQLTASNTFYSHLLPDQEAYYASIAAKKLNIPLTRVQADEFPIQNPLPALIDMGAIYQTGIYEAMAKSRIEYGNVILAGYGGDEVFAPTLLMQVLAKKSPSKAIQLYREVWRITGKRPSLRLASHFKQRFNRKTTNSVFFANTDYPKWLNPDFEARFHLKEQWETYFSTYYESDHPLNPIAHAYLLQADWDKTTELVHEPNFVAPNTLMPFLDLRLIDFLLSLPPQLSLTPKYLLREAMRGILPNEIIERKKSALGFGLARLLQLPEAKWIDEWEILPELSQYIQRDAIPAITGWDINPAFQLNNIRPFIVNNWLKAVLIEFGN